MIHKRLRRRLAWITALVLCLPSGQIFAAEEADPGDKFNADQAALINAQDESAYFSRMELSIGSQVLSVDGKEQEMDVVPELIGAGYTMLPIRAVAEAAGAKVDWEAETRSVFITSRAGDTITCRIGSDILTINGRPTELEVTPYIKGERTYLPLRAVTEALEMDVEWIQETRTVVLSAPYQTGRLMVLAEELETGGLGADTVLYDGSGFWLLQFSSPTKAKQAAALLATNGIEAAPDIYMPPQEGYEAAEAPEGDFDSDSDSYISWGAEDAGFDTFLKRYSSLFASSVTVAVVDTGVDSAHEMLMGRVVSGHDYVDGDNEPQDEHCRGTFLAGTVVDCTRNAPVKILSVRVLNKNASGYYSRYLHGIKYAADKRADVILLAQQTAPDIADFLCALLRYAVGRGAVPVVAAGDGGKNTFYACPGHITAAGTLVASAGDSGHQRAGFSNFGTNIDVMAAGVDVKSAAPGDAYMTGSGTAAAAAHVAAAVALLDLATGKKLTSAQLEAKLHTATSYGTRKNNYEGYGWLDLTKTDIPAPEPALDSYAFSPDALELDVGETGKVAVYAVYSDGSKEDVTREAGLQSSDPNVASVDPDGTVTALAEGSAAITITRLGGSVPEPVAVTVSRPAAEPYTEIYWALRDSSGKVVRLDGSQDREIRLNSNGNAIRLFGVTAGGTTVDLTAECRPYSMDESILKCDPSTGELSILGDGSTYLYYQSVPDTKIAIPGTLSVLVECPPLPALDPVEGAGTKSAMI